MLNQSEINILRFSPENVEKHERTGTENLYFGLGYYSNCDFHKLANSKVQKPPSHLRFLLPSIIIAITSNEP